LLAENHTLPVCWMPGLIWLLFALGSWEYQRAIPRRTRVPLKRHGSPRLGEEHPSQSVSQSNPSEPQGMPLQGIFAIFEKSLEFCQPQNRHIQLIGIGGRHNPPTAVFCFRTEIEQHRDHWNCIIRTNRNAIDEGWTRWVGDKTQKLTFRHEIHFSSQPLSCLYVVVYFYHGYQ